MSTDNNNSFASHVYRAFEETKRISTGYVNKDGSFYQTYPTKELYYSLAAWRSKYPSCEIVGEDEEFYNAVLSWWGPTYIQNLERKMRQYAERIAQRPTAEPPSESVSTVVEQVITEPPAPVMSDSTLRKYIHNLMEDMSEARGVENRSAAGAKLYRFILDKMMDVINTENWKNFRTIAIEKCYEFKRDNGCSIQLKSILDEFLTKIGEPSFASVPTPPPHVPSPMPSPIPQAPATPLYTPRAPQDSQVAYVATAVFGNDNDGKTFQQKVCLSLEGASRAFHNYYRAYCLMMDEDEHFMDNKLTVHILRRALDSSRECNVAFFDSLQLSIRETRVWL